MIEETYLHHYPQRREEFLHVCKRFGYALVGVCIGAHFKAVAYGVIRNGEDGAGVVFHLCESPIPVGTESAATIFVKQESVFLTEGFNFVVRHNCRD